MDLTGDLIGIQSILTRLIKNTGEFTKINFRGGNEDIILKVMLEIQGYLKDQKYITEENKPNKEYNRQLEEIVFFLALNTSYKNTLEIEEYSHLINITPPFSKCLFANVVYGLDLCEYYCIVIEKLPINNCVELLEEVLQCLKKSTPNIQLKYSNMFLHAVGNKLSNITYSKKVEEQVESLCETTNIMLLDLHKMSPDHIKTWNKDEIYNHMGLCLLNLLESLLKYDQNCLALRKFLENILRTCVTIVKCVTLDVFCAWAEKKIEDESLQTVVSNKAYLVLETYDQFPGARDLINMLKSIAKKPKTLNEQLFEANIDTIVKKVNKKDSDQKFWFKALIRTRFFEDSDAFNCVRAFYYLCDDEDVTNLLNCYKHNNNEECAKLIIKCASHLDLANLTTVATKYFYKNKFENFGSTDVEKTLTWRLNKLKEDSGKEDLAKDILIIFIQQPTAVLTHLYTECLKNNFYTNILKETFTVLREIIKIKNIGTTILFTVGQKKPPSEQNIDNYIHLLITLVEIEYFSNDEILLEFLDPMLKKYYEEKSLEELNFVLQMFLGGRLTLPVIEDTKHLIELLLTIMNENRSKFLNYNGLKHQIAKHAVDICYDVCKPNYSSEVHFTINEEDCFTRYYRSYLTSGREMSLLKNLCGSFCIRDYGNSVNTILKFIPPAVNREWLIIAQEIIDICGNEKCIELFTDVLILLSQLVETQDIDKNNSIYSALKDCVRNYGLVLQQKLLDNSNLETEIEVNRQVCRLLAKLPNSLKGEEGLLLVNLLTDRSLKSLANDKEFLCHLILIKNPQVCQVLAQKITGSF